MRAPGQATVLGVGAVGLVATAAAAAYVGDQVSKRLPRYRQQSELYAEYERMMMPPRKDLQALEDDILKQMEDSMKKAGASSIMMLPTFVTRLPTGDETGSCYALDVGGTNFRAMYCHLGAARGAVDASVIEGMAIPKEIYTSTATAFFDFLATSLRDFIARHNPSDLTARPTVGFCFSFPMQQLALDSATLVEWTKGFDVSGVTGNDVVKLLSDALARAGAPCRVSAILNDSVGVLAAARYHDPATDAGVILGTGTNACIVERVERLSKWRAPAGTPPGAMTAINTEWGCYASQFLPRTPEDLALDAASGPCKGKMLIEKLMSGLYLGECARRHLLTFSRRAGLFGPSPPPALETPGSFTTAHLAAVESDASPLRSGVKAALREAFGDGVMAGGELGLETLYMVQSVCRLVVRRSARMAAIMLTAVLRLQGWLTHDGAAAAAASPRRVVVAVDGGVFLKYRNWRLLLDVYLKESLEHHAGKDGRRLASLLEFRPTADGSCLGAAVLAAAAVAGRG